MNIFTPQFRKDSILSLFILVFLYLITHNPIVKPTPKLVLGMWSIEKMQHPLVFGFTGHNFLVLRDENNQIVKELHGLATDSNTNTWKYIGTKYSDLLKVWEFDGPRNPALEKTYPGIVLAQGTEADMENLWSKAENCKEEINKKTINYPPYGFALNGQTENSNSVSSTLSFCMGINDKHIGLITPGERKNLLSK